jgi:hypothetical protein
MTLQTLTLFELSGLLYLGRYNNRVRTEYNVLLHWVQLALFNRTYVLPLKPCAPWGWNSYLPMKRSAHEQAHPVSTNKFYHAVLMVAHTDPKSSSQKGALDCEARPSWRSSGHLGQQHLPI